MPLITRPGVTFDDDLVEPYLRIHGVCLIMLSLWGHSDDGRRGYGYVLYDADHHLLRCASGIVPDTTEEIDFRAAADALLGLLIAGGEAYAALADDPETVFDASLTNFVMQWCHEHYDELRTARYELTRISHSY